MNAIETKNRKCYIFFQNINIVKNANYYRR